MHEPLTELQRLLRSGGYSVTQARRQLFELLADGEPQSMHQLVKRASGLMDRASVYRTVEVFEQLGVVRRITIGWKYKIELSDSFAEHHHHLACLRCQRIIPINESDLERFMDVISAKHGFQPTDHQVEIQGYCSDCATQAT